jgi:hypothetical protein
LDRATQINPSRRNRPEKTGEEGGGKERKKKLRDKTINSRYSLVVTHPTTNLPAHGLSTTERTGRPAFHVLWSIAEEFEVNLYIYGKNGS